MTYVDDLTKCSDAELINELRHGDKRALGVIFDRYAWTLDSYINGLMSWNGRASFQRDKDEVVKMILINVFDRLWEGHEKLRIQADLGKHLNKMAAKTLLTTKFSMLKNERHF